MEIPCDCNRLPYHGWERCSCLTPLSLEGTVAAGAILFFGEVCKCHIVLCKQFDNSDHAVHAVERKAVVWIDDRETVPAMELAGGSNAYATA